MANLNLTLPPPMLEAIDKFAAKHATKTRIRVTRTAAARALIQMGQGGSVEFVRNSFP